MRSLKMCGILRKQGPSALEQGSSCHLCRRGAEHTVNKIVSIAQWTKVRKRMYNPLVGEDIVLWSVFNSRNAGLVGLVGVRPENFG